MRFDNARNYLTKVQRYSKVYDNVNSISHRADFVRACLDLWERRAPFGIYNVTNPGFVTTRQVVSMIETILKPARKFEFWASDEEFYRSGRENTPFELRHGRRQIACRRRQDAAGRGSAGRVAYAIGQPRESDRLMNLLVTGGAGFIGSNLIHHIIDRPEIERLVNLDCLTYAGHLANLEQVADSIPNTCSKKWICATRTPCCAGRQAACHHPRDASGGGVARRSFHHRAGRFHPDQYRRHFQFARSLPRRLGRTEP